MTAWSLVRIDADGVREQIFSGRSEASTITAAIGHSHADHESLYEVRADERVVLRMKAGRMVEDLLAC